MNFQIGCMYVWMCVCVTSEQIKTYITNVIQISNRRSLLCAFHGSYHFVRHVRWIQLWSETYCIICIELHRLTMPVHTESKNANQIHLLLVKTAPFSMIIKLFAKWFFFPHRFHSSLIPVDKKKNNEVKTVMKNFYSHFLMIVKWQRFENLNWKSVNITVIRYT